MSGLLLTLLGGAVGGILIWAMMFTVVFAGAKWPDDTD